MMGILQLWNPHFFFKAFPAHYYLQLTNAFVEQTTLVHIYSCCHFKIASTTKKAASQEEFYKKAKISAIKKRLMLPSTVLLIKLFYFKELIQLAILNASALVT